MLPQSEELDFAAAQAAMLRRRQVAQALLAQSAQPLQGQMVSGHYVPPSKLQGLAQLLSGLAGGKMEKDLDAKEQELSKGKKAALEKGLADYVDLRMGSPDQPMGPPTLEGEFGLQPGTKANPRLAAIRAVASQMPELRQLGMMDLQALGKQEQETFGTTPIRTQDGRTVVLGNRGGLKEVPVKLPEEFITVGDRVLPKSNPTAPVADFSKTFTELKYIDGDLYQKSSDGKWNKLDNAPKVNVGAPRINLGQRKIVESWAKAAVDTVNDLATSARGSVKLLGTLNQLEASAKAGVQGGPLAPAGVWIAGLAEQLNVPVDKAKLANSQTFDAAAISAWQDMIAAAGGNRGVVKEEAARIAQMVPQLTQSPQGRAQITAFLRQAAQQQITDAQTAQKELADALNADNPALFTFGLSGAQLPRTGGLPAAPGAASPSGKPQPVVRNW